MAVPVARASGVAGRGGRSGGGRGARRREEASRLKSFWYGQVSAAVEPYALAFAAGAMIYVVVEELIPEAQRRGRTDLVTSATVVGFTAMMILDLAFG